MDRQAHDFTAAAAMAYAQQQRQAATNIQQQQQQQFGYPPQHQQFPPSVHGGPFLSPHPSLQQFPYHQQFPPHPHPHLVHLQQQQQPPPFPPHLPAHLVPSPFHGGVYESAPPAPPAPPPSDPDLHKRIDKLAEYAAKNGPEFEAMIREKQQDNPEYSFLFGGEGHDYYRYNLWSSTRPPTGPFNPSVPVMRPPPNSMIGSPMNVVSGGSSSLIGAPQLHQHPFPPFYDQMQHHPHSHSFVGQGRPDYDQSSLTFKGLSGPLPSDVAMELSNVLISLSGTKESIKGAKIWFMQRSPFAPALAEALRERVFAMDDSERQLHIIYLANDILFDSLQRRINLRDLDNEALAFKPVLGSMLAKIYHNPQNKEENQSRLQKILQFWASKEVFDQNTIYDLEKEMLGGPPTNYYPGPPKDFSGSLTDPAMISGISQQIRPNISRWQSDAIVNQDHLDKQVTAVPGIAHTLTNQQFIPTSIPTGAYMGSMPISSSFQASSQQPPPAGEKLPPYPLFPPGLIPGMVRKMQIGSGVPYSPMSPLDIPTVIPPSTSSPSETLERVSKFFKEIGEANPSEGPMKPSETNNNGDDDDEYGYDREAVVRKGGACIPPPLNLQADPETGTYPDGTVERKPGSSSSGRLGLGATANPNEASQYDDVYSSYRKHRSTNYHTSMSARATTR